MAVPKKRTGKSAQGKRRASWKASVPAITTCKTCGEAVPAHTVCPKCGSYKGKVVSIKNKNLQTAAPVEEKPATPVAEAKEGQVEEKPKAKRTRKPKAKTAEEQVQAEEKTEK